MRGRRPWLLLAIGTLVLIVIGALAVRSLREEAQNVTTGSPPCSPRPCAAPNGFEVDISNLAGAQGVVTMDVRFKNRTRPDAFEAVSYRHTSPADFQIRGLDGHQAGPIFNEQCPNWGELDIKRGADAGPEHLCFPEPAGGLERAQIVWSPDLGFLFDSVQIPLD